MTILTHRTRLTIRVLRRGVRRGVASARTLLRRRIQAARAQLLRVTLWLADRLRGPVDPEIALGDSDIMVLTPRSLEKLELERPELAIPRRPLAEAVVRRGWMVVGETTIMGLGSPVVPQGPHPNERDGDPSASSPAWKRDDLH
jgi:hypothetical protein